MNRLSVLVLSIGLLYSVAELGAQNQSAPHAQDQSPGPDLQQLQNIYVPPVSNAPFTAMVVSSTRGYLNLRSYSRIARDSAGRIFEERRSYVTTDFRGVHTHHPDLGAPSQGPRVTRLLYIDPTQRVAYDCTAGDHLCRISPYDFSSTATEPKMVSSRPGVTVKALGQREIHGLHAIGSREVTSLPSGVSSLPSPDESSGWGVKEFWYSPDLQINLITKRKSAGYESESIVVQSVRRHEPDAKLFVPPARYKMVLVGLPQGKTGPGGTTSKSTD